MDKYVFKLGNKFKVKLPENTGMEKEFNTKGEAIGFAQNYFKELRQGD